jgi:hypothetical protein
MESISHQAVSRDAITRLPPGEWICDAMTLPKPEPRLGQDHDVWCPRGNRDGAFPDFHLAMMRSLNKKPSRVGVPLSEIKLTAHGVR